MSRTAKADPAIEYGGKCVYFLATRIRSGLKNLRFDNLKFSQKTQSNQIRQSDMAWLLMGKRIGGIRISKHNNVRRYQLVASNVHPSAFCGERWAWWYKKRQA